MPILGVALALLGLLAVAQVLESRSECRSLTAQEKLVLPILFTDPASATVCDMPPEWRQRYAVKD
jgi:hypothetical protein